MEAGIYKPKLSANALKLVAAVTMLIDHTGAILFPKILWLRIVGRLAFPIYAFMVAQGCKYTRNGLRYFLSMFTLGVICQVVYSAAEGSDRLNILLTFSVSIALSLLLHGVKRAIYTQKWAKAALLGAGMAAAVMATYYVNLFVVFDYGFWGCMTPVIAGVFLQKEDAPLQWKRADRNWVHVIMLAIPLIQLSRIYYLQEYALIALLPLLLYSGSRGKYRLKYAFYLFYPLHLALLYGISLLMQ